MSLLAHVFKDIFNWASVFKFDLFKIDAYFAFHLADTYTNNFMTFVFQGPYSQKQPFYQFYTYIVY